MVGLVTGVSEFAEPAVGKSLSQRREGSRPRGDD